MEFKHIPVLYQETLDGLNLKIGGTYVDCTLGGGGHSEGILKAIGKTGRLIAFDQDDEAIAATSARLAEYADQLTIVKTNFAEIENVINELGIAGVDGILYDIGVSSHQIDTRERGFSYMQDAPLDMRMDKSRPLTAKIIVNTYDEKELADIIYLYGEERYSRRIAGSIIYHREKKEIETTLELAEIIRKAIPKGVKIEDNPAKRTFQALRIAINDELDVLRKGIVGGYNILSSGGRMAVITFHSLEDRIVKEQFREWVKGCTCPSEIPICVCGKKPSVKLVNRKPITGSKEELEENSRARSAKLRVMEKL